MYSYWKGQMALIDLRDLGAAIAEILSSDGHGGKEYNVTGSEALDHAQVASILSEVTGRSIVHNDLSDDAYIQKMLEKGWTEKAAKHALWLFQRVREGSEEVVTQDIEHLLKRKPYSFREFAQNEFG